jgi:hypothetical protein
MRTDNRGSDVPLPGYIRIAGGFTLVLGMLIVIWTPYSSINPWSLKAVGAVVTIGGAGLVVGQRWAWPFLFVIGLPFLLAAYVFFLPESETEPFELDHWAGVVFLAVGCLLLVASVTRGTRRWLSGRSAGR